MAPTRPSQTFTTTLLVLLSALQLATPAWANVNPGPRPADPFADPANDPYNLLGYIANNTLTAIAVSLVVVVTVIQFVSACKWGGWWVWALFLGEITYVVGLAFRFKLHSDPENPTAFKVQYLLIILSPCAFIAADYVILGRLARHLDAGRFLLISPNRITLVFLTSDIVTFLIQAAGGVITVASNDANKKKLGDHIFIAGLALQLASFIFFFLTFCLFIWRLYKSEPKIWICDAHRGWFHDWRALAVTLAISCVCITERSIYRLVEISVGFFGYLARNEAYFYAFDVLFIWMAIAVFAPFWPGRFIRISHTIPPEPMDPYIPLPERKTVGP